jgi:methenyltetrahydromethanopterin cyclohydrolase
LHISVHDVAGARVIDAGIHVPGGLQAGLALARICVADLADVSIQPGNIDSLSFPIVQVHSDDPVRACLASQYAGWQIAVGKYFAMGSGPKRAHYGKEDLFDHIPGRESVIDDDGLSVNVTEVAQTLQESLLGSQNAGEHCEKTDPRDFLRFLRVRRDV